MAHRDHSDETVTRAKSMHASGMSDKKIAGILGISRDTVKRWTRDGKLPTGADAKAIEEKTEQATEAIASRLEVMVPEMLDAAREQIPNAKLKDLLIGAGIGIEKIQLLRGRATARTAEIRVTFHVPALSELPPALPVRTAPERQAIEGEYTEVGSKTEQA